MKYLFFFLSVTLFSCAPAKMLPLTSQYPSTPMLFNSDKSFEKTWDNLIDVFAQKGLSIKIIDRSSGLIISQKSELSATIEDKNGKLYDPHAFIAIPCYIANGKRVPVSNPNAAAYSTQKKIIANPVYGDWNVRIKPTASGGSTINVNITNLNYEIFDYKLKENKLHSLTEYKSTGVFENILVDLIK